MILFRKKSNTAFNFKVAHKVCVHPMALNFALVLLGAARTQYKTQYEILAYKQRGKNQKKTLECPLKRYQWQHSEASDGKLDFICSLIPGGYFAVQYFMRKFRLKLIYLFVISTDKFKWRS